MRPPILLVLSAGLVLISVILGLSLGSASLGGIEVFSALLGQTKGLAFEIIWKLRAPRVISAFACGGLLALSGALLQALLRNALADSYILGVSGGAALGSLLAIFFGLGGILMHLTSLLGALGAIAMVFLISFRQAGWNMDRLILCGVVLSSGLSALCSLILVLAPGIQVKGMLFWLMGDLSYADQPGLAFVVLLFVFGLSMSLSSPLDLMGLGEAKARSLGVRWRGAQIGLFLAAAFATVAAVILGGAIGFVGLMVPHAIRLMGVRHHRFLLPVAVLIGGSFLVIADTGARTVWAPQQLPVGVITALMGVPFMLWLLMRSKRA
jgi:iron complex transport system permease protein